MNIYYVKTDDRAKVPTRAHNTDSGLDLYACLDEEIIIDSKQTLLVPTGIAIELPEPLYLETTSISGWASETRLGISFEAQIRSKSGIAAKQGLFVLNSPGTVDYGYSGELKVVLHNSSESPLWIKHQQPIAQLVVCPVLIPELVKKPGGYTQLYNSNTSRGDKGFGSSYVFEG